MSLISLNWKVQQLKASGNNIPIHPYPDRTITNLAKKVSVLLQNSTKPSYFYDYGKNWTFSHRSTIICLYK